MRKFFRIMLALVLLAGMESAFAAYVNNPMTVDLSGGGYKITNLGDIVTKGPWKDVRSYASFSAALTAIGTTPTTLLIPNSQNVTANVEVKSNVTLWFLNGGKLNISSGVTVTINGQVDARNAQIFTGAGSVVFGVGAVKELVATWWGANGAAIQSALNALPVLGGTVYMPGGTYALSSSLIMPAGKKTHLYGDGSETLLTANGLDGFLFAGSGYYQSIIENFRIQGSNAAGKAAFTDNPDPYSNMMAGVRFRNLQIQVFKIGFLLRDAQINFFEDINVGFNDPDGNSIVFDIIPTNGQNVNSNRVYRLHATGPGRVLNMTLPTSLDRCTNWLFKDCDIQVTGTGRTFTFKDSGHIIDGCEFENSSADYLMVFDTASYCMIQNNIFCGGTTPLLFTAAGGAYNCYQNLIMNNQRGNGAVLADQVNGISNVFISNAGTINDTGGQYTTVLGAPTPGALQVLGAPNVGVMAGAISGTTTLGNNLRGSLTIEDNYTSGDVEFHWSRQEGDTDYYVVATVGAVTGTPPPAGGARRVSVTTKTTAGFTVELEAAPGTGKSVIVDWIMMR